MITFVTLISEAFIHGNDLFLVLIVYLWARVKVSKISRSSIYHYSVILMYLTIVIYSLTATLASPFQNAVSDMATVSRKQGSKF